MRNNERTPQTPGNEIIISLWDLVDFFKKWRYFVFAATLLGAAGGAAYWYVSPPLFQSDVSIEWDVENLAISVDAGSFKANLVKLFRQPDLSTAFSQAYFDEFDRLSKNDGPFQESAKAADAYFLKKFSNAVLTPVEGFSQFLSGRMVSGQFDAREKIGFVYNLSIGSESDSPNAMRMTLRTEEQGIVGASTLATVAAVNHVAETFNKREMGALLRSRWEQVDLAKEASENLRKRYLEIKGDYDLGRARLRVNFYKIASEIQRLGRQGRESSLSVANDFPLPMGNASQNFFSDSQLTTNAMENLEFLSITKQLGHLSETKRVNEAELESFLTRLTKLESAKSELEGKYMVTIRSSSSSEAGLARTIDTATSPIDISKISLPRVKINPTMLDKMIQSHQYERRTETTFSYLSLGAIFGFFSAIGLALLLQTTRFLQSAALYFTPRPSNKIPAKSSM